MSESINQSWNTLLRGILGPRAAMLYLGVLVCGVAISLLRTTPDLAWTRNIRAVASQGQETSAIATGYVQEGIEGLFYLDYLTGDLRGVLLNSNTGKFTASFTRNVFGDLNLKTASTTPKLLLVLGQVNLRKQGAAQFADSVVYVVDDLSGACIAYAIPLAPNTKSRGQATLEFLPIDSVSFRNAQLRQ